MLKSSWHYLIADKCYSNCLQGNYWEIPFSDSTVNGQQVKGWIKDQKLSNPQTKGIKSHPIGCCYAPHWLLPVGFDV